MASDDHDSDSGTITQLLEKARCREAGAENALFDAVYAHLRRRARQILRGDRNSSLISSGTLVHEAYLKLFRPDSGLSFENRRHFYEVAARVMKRLIVDQVRRTQAAKREGNRVKVTLTDYEFHASETRLDDALAIDEACNQLKAAAPELERIIVLRFFGGLTIEETAQVLGVSDTTAQKRLRIAKAQLHRYLTTGHLDSQHATRR